MTATASPLPGFRSKPATRQSVKPLIVLYGESGTGKTMSSLLLARGFVGPAGKIEMVDTERGRGQLYADVIPGSYNVTEFDEPFFPSRFIEVIKHVEQLGAQIGVLDSGSAEWEGAPGGVLDLAAENEARTGKTGLHVWRQPKIEHAQFVQALLRSTIPWVVCLRAKHKSRQVKEGGKTIIIKDDHASPLQSEEFIFEATCHGEILPDHSLRLTKWSHPSLKSCFPAQGPITIEHGAMVRAWCDTPGSAPAAKPPQTTVDALKKQLWSVCLGRVGKDKASIEARLIEWSILPVGKTLSDLNTVEALTDALDKVELQLTP